MKKLFVFMGLLMGLIAFTACESHNTPTAVAKDAYTAMKNHQYDKLSNMMVTNEGEELTEEQHQAIAAMLEEKTTKDRKDINSFKIVNEELGDGGRSAVVTVKVDFADGTSRDDEMRLVKDKQGCWRVAFGK